MVYLSHTPGPPLDAFVENLWSLSDAPPHARERILPSGTLELVINLHQDLHEGGRALRSEPLLAFSAGGPS